MKAQRRHQLKTNTLATGLETLPDLAKKHGSKILLGVIIVLLAFVFVRNMIQSGQKDKADAKAALALARSNISDLNANAFRATLNPDLMHLIRQYADDAREGIKKAQDLSDEPEIRAESLVALGDLNWFLASMPSLPAAATRPDLSLPQKSEEYLKQAEAAYKELESKYPDQKLAIISARLGLAAIAENRGDWAAAKDDYEQVAKSDTTLKGYRDYAQAKIDQLPKIEEPIFIGEPATRPAAASMPSTQPADTLSGTITIPAPTTLPSVRPTTRAFLPAAAATEPSALAPSLVIPAPATTRTAP